MRMGMLPGTVVATIVGTQHIQHRNSLAVQLVPVDFGDQFTKHKSVGNNAVFDGAGADMSVEEVRENMFPDDFPRLFGYTDEMGLAGDRIAESFRLIKDSAFRRDGGLGMEVHDDGKRDSGNQTGNFHDPEF